MSDPLDESIALFRNYRSLWGNKLYLDGQLITPQNKTDSPLAAVTDTSISTGINTAPAQKSAELQQFFLEIRNCQKCPLGASRKKFVFGTGNPHADLMLIGEAPGKDEDESGVPFVGRAGKLLDKMLQAIQLERDEIFIANVLKCRPPQNRDPLPAEIKQCEPYLLRQLEMIRPKVLLALGRIAGQNLLKIESSLSDMRNQDYRYKDIPLIVTYHPAALLRNPRWKQYSWQDLKKVKNILDTL